MATLQEITSKFRASNYSTDLNLREQVAPSVQTSVTSASPRGLAEPLADIAEIGTDIGASFASRGERLNEIDRARASGEQGLFRSATQVFGQGLGFAGDIIGSTFKGIGKVALTEEAERDVGRTFINFAQGVGNTEIAQEAAQTFSELKTRDPATARDLETALNFVMIAVDVGTVGVARAPVTAGAKIASETALKVAGETGRVAGKAADLPGFVATEIQGTLTGTSGETARQAFAAARRGGAEMREFTEALRKQITPESLVQKLRDSATEIEIRKTREFGNSLAQFGDDTVSTGDVLSSVTRDLAEVGVKVVDGQLDFSASKFRTVPNAQSKLQQMYDEVVGLGSEQTIRGVDTSRQALGALLLAGDDASARTANFVITRAINNVRGAGTPAYRDALLKFGDDAEYLTELNRALSAGDRASVDTAYRKLITSLKTNNEQRMGLLRELDEATGGNLLSAIAGQQLSEELPRGLFRQIAASLGGFGVLTGSVTTAFLPGLLFASPRITGELLLGLGITARKVDDFVDAIDQVRRQIFPNRLPDAPLPKASGAATPRTANVNSATPNKTLTASEAKASGMSFDEWVKGQNTFGVDIKEMSHNDFVTRFGEQMRRHGGGDYASGVYFIDTGGKPTIWINKEWLDMKATTPGVSREAMKNARIQHELGHHIYENVLTARDRIKLKAPTEYKNDLQEWFSDAYFAWTKGKNESWMGNIGEVIESKIKTRAQLKAEWDALPGSNQ